MTRALGARVRSLLRPDAPPRRSAAALATGVFISCTPFYGLQTLLALLVATIFRLNRAVTVTGAWLNLPWFAPLVYGAALWVGSLLVPDEHGLGAAEVTALLRASGSFSWSAVFELLRGVSAALLIGTTVVGGAAALATYVVALGVLRRRRGRGIMRS